MVHTLRQVKAVDAVVFTCIDLCKQKGAVIEFLKSNGIALLGASMSSSIDSPFRFFQPGQDHGKLENIVGLDGGVIRIKFPLLTRQSGVLPAGHGAAAHAQYLG